MTKQEMTQIAPEAPPTSVVAQSVSRGVPPKTWRIIRAPALRTRSHRPFISSTEIRRTFALDTTAAILYSPFAVATVTFPAVIMRNEGAPSIIISLIMAANPIGQLTMLLWSRYTDRWNKMRTQLLFGIAARALMITLAFVYSPLIFALILIGVNILEQAKAPAYGTIMQQVYPDEQRGRMMANVRVGVSFGNMLSSAGLGKLLEIASYRLVMPVAGVFGVLSLLVFSRIRYTEVPQAKGQGLNFRYLLTIPKRDKAYGMFLAATFISGFLNWVVAALYPYLLVDELHASNFMVGILSAVGSIVSVVAYIYWGRYLDRHHPMLLTFLSFVFTFTTAICYAIAWNEWVLIPAAVLNGIGAAGFDLAFINTCIRFPKDRADVPRYLALYSALVGVRGLLAPFMVGALVPFVNIRVLLWVTVGLMIVGLLNYYSVQRTLIKSGAVLDEA